MTDHVLIEKCGGVLVVTLNRPEKKNALTSAMYRRMASAIADAEQDPQVRAVLLQANGDMFTAGNDLAEFAALNVGDATEPPSASDLLRVLPGLEIPLVAAVQGGAVGIGLTLLLHCDLVYVAEDALLSSPFVNLALAPEAASSLLLPARIGHVRAFEMFALGQAVDGRTAAAWGLANAAVPAGEVQAKARAAAEALAQRPPAAVRVTKSLMRDPALISARVEEELVHFQAQLKSPEAREAFAAFFEKRTADFSRL